MVRVKRGTISLKRRRSVLKAAKGYRFARSKKEAAAKEALQHAGKHAFNHRRLKKREFRRTWTIRINAAVRNAGYPSYSQFMNALKKKGVAIDRKSLSELAQNHPEAFTRLVNQVK